MSELNESAAEHLQVIRQLMERATVYRAVSVPGALVGGVMALGLGAWQSCRMDKQGLMFNAHMEAREFFWPWIVVFFVAAILNGCMLKREADRRGEAFFSSGMKMGLGALLPPLGIGFAISVLFLPMGVSPLGTAVVWILCYGLGLHATGGFAPRSIKLLGHAFMAVGTSLVLLWTGIAWFAPNSTVVQWITGPVLMAGVFGLLHVVYAAGVWVRSRKKAA